MDPVPGYPVTTPWGVPGSWAAGRHTGEDRAAPAWTPVLACVGGVVVQCGWNGDYGNTVTVETDGVRSMYCHLVDWSVWNGQIVIAGEPIGWVGSTGRSTGPHLHLEERTWPFGYGDDRKPQFPYLLPEAAPIPVPEEDDDMKPWVVNAGDRGWVITDLATYWCGVTNIAIVNEGVTFGAYQKFADGAALGPGWVDHIWRLPRVDAVS